MDIFAYITVELSRETFAKFIIFSCPWPLADFENNSSPHSQGWSPRLGTGQVWAWCCMAGFAPGQGAGAGAEQNRALSSAVMSRHCRLDLLPCCQRLSLTWIFHLSISFTLAATYTLLSSNWAECCNFRSQALILMGSSSRPLPMFFLYILNCL